MTASVYDLSRLTPVRGLGLRAFEQEGFNLLSVLKQDPDQGHDWIAEHSAAILAEAQQAPHGVLYRLGGCDPAHTSPMEYGGYFVPAETAILQQLKAPRVLWVEPAAETYFEFLADIPCDVFGWDTAHGPTVRVMRALRSEPLMANDPEAEYQPHG